MSKKILFVTRHEILPSQLLGLQQLFGSDVKVVHDAAIGEPQFQTGQRRLNEEMFFDHLLRRMQKEGFDQIVLVAPDRVYARLVVAGFTPLKPCLLPVADKRHADVVWNDRAQRFIGFQQLLEARTGKEGVWLEWGLLVPDRKQETATPKPPKVQPSQAPQGSSGSQDLLAIAEANVASGLWKKGYFNWGLNRSNGKPQLQCRLGGVVYIPDSGGVKIRTGLTYVFSLANWLKPGRVAVVNIEEPLPKGHKGHDQPKAASAPAAVPTVPKVPTSEPAEAEAPPQLENKETAAPGPEQGPAKDEATPSDPEPAALEPIKEPETEGEPPVEPQVKAQPDRKTASIRPKRQRKERKKKPSALSGGQIAAAAELLQMRLCPRI